MPKLLLLLVAAIALAWSPPATALQSSAATAAAETAPLVVWNREITVFRARYENHSASDRADRAAQRILTIEPQRGQWAVATAPGTLGPYSGFFVTVNGQMVFGLMEADADRASGETVEQAAQAAAERLRELYADRARQREWPVLLRGLGLSLLATFLLVVALFAVARAGRVARARLEPRLARLRARSVVGGVNLWPILGGLGLVLRRFVAWFVVGSLTYLWLTYVLVQFPYTEPWGDALGHFLVGVLRDMGWAVLHALPGLFMVAVIFALAQAFARGVGSFFSAAEAERIRVPWLTSETARATRQLTALLIWAFALVLAYPYIPGSDTAAFKGISVMLGIMVSLGSAGLVNHVMSGLAVVYSRAFRRGDFVRIGDQEGRVLEVGLLSTKIARPTGEELTIPNAVVASQVSTNHSRADGGAADLLSTTVTIGYDAPWRQVHALLLQAAERTPELVREPAPFVLQRALSDFYVEYQLVVQVPRKVQRSAVQTRLLAEIQDAFNEHGVQIMSPHFVGQPASAVVVPRSAWHAAPASADPARGT